MISLRSSTKKITTYNIYKHILREVVRWQARGCNNLPPETRAASSLLTYRRETWSFSSSVIWLTEIWRCPCWRTVQLSARARRSTLSVLIFVKCARNC